MDRLKTLQTFVCVAEHASFAEAGRRLNMSPTTVTRSIAALEASLGVALLMRTTRSVRLTEEGAAFLERARAGLAEIDSAFEAARGSRLAPRGTLTVTAPVMFGRLHILPVVAEMLGRYSDLRVRLLLLDRVVRLVEEGIDIAVRIADLPDSALHVQRIGAVRRVLSASPAYIKAHGKPMALTDLRHHQLIAVEDEVGPQRGWGVEGGARRLPRLSINNVDAAIAAAVSGLGIVRSLSYQVTDHLAAGRLVPVLDGDQASSVPVSLLFHSGRKNQPNIRAFIEVAQRQLALTGVGQSRATAARA
ncbi:MAG: LysR family transcriptional regulator [Sphingomonadales bacterium]|nr:LysR family transcriptional regulator [Sphingomonadales bacterium]MDE2171484.1 LysR family transcriptional regulator [Sphingomonadales bacterium]